MSGDGTGRQLADVLRNAIRAELLELHVSMPGEVVSFDPDHQRCDVQPLLRRTVAITGGTTEAQPLPVISHVPVHYQQGGGYRHTFPLAKGDRVLLVFAERSLDAWLASAGGLATPGDSRHHDLSDAIAIPGLAPFDRAIAGIGTEDLVVGREDGSGELRIRPDGTMQLGGRDGARGVARLNDATVVNGTTDPNMIAWMAAVSTACAGILATGAAFSTALGTIGGPPQSIGGKINEASEDVEAT